MLRYEYARAALKTGLELEHQLDVNPYTFGMIGSTDSSSGLATSDDDNFWLSTTPTGGETGDQTAKKKLPIGLRWVGRGARNLGRLKSANAQDLCGVSASPRRR